MVKCPKCGFTETTHDLEIVIKILELLDKNPNSTIKEIHDMLGGLEKLWKMKVYRAFSKLMNAGLIIDVGQTKDVPNKKITDVAQLRSRVFVSNIRIIRKDKYVGSK